MTSKELPGKPEWFELIDGNAPSAQVNKVNKVLPALAVLVSGALLATGALFGNASSDPAQSALVSQTTSAPVASANLSPLASATPAGENQGTPVLSPSTEKSSITPVAPIMLPPTGGDDDDDDDDEDRRDHDHDD
jgi:hypothetical protein